MIGALQRHAKSRGLALGVVALAAIAWRTSAGAPPPRSIEGIAAALGAASGGTVRPDDFLWEERGGFLEETFLGRRVLFLASRAEGAPRDLYRARVRLTRGGRPLSVSGVRNLTSTPDGDDRDLTGAGHHVAFATATPDGVQGVTLLDLQGAPPPAAGAPSRAIASIDRWLATGTSRGLARTEIAFAEAPSEAKFEVAQGALVLSLGAEAVPAALDFATGVLQTGRANPFAAAARSIPEPPRPGGDVIADLLESALGPAAASPLRGVIARSPLAAGSRMDPVAPGGPRLAADYPTDGGWPPAPLVPVHPTPFDGEGFWHVSPSIQGGAEKSPPPLLEAIVRPDPNNPSAIVHLIAIDTRRLDVHITPGVASPRPTTGPHGSGLLPRSPGGGAPPAAPASDKSAPASDKGAPASDKGASPAADSRVVAVFVAGPASTSRSLGFFGEGRLLAPLVPGAPSLAVRPDGRAVLGAWPESASRDAFVAIAQAPDALAEVTDRDAASAPPSFPPRDATARIGRAALCRTKAGYLIHAFAPSVPAASLRAGLTLAGCTAALHLGASPSPLGFAYVKGAVAEGASDPVYTGTPASPSMTLPLDRIAGPWPQEIGVITLREPGPLTSAKSIAWSPDAGTQPPPAWLPAVVSAETEQLGAKVKLHAFLPERVTFRIAAGKDETVTSRGDKPGPTEADRSAALASFGVSVAKRGQRRGLVIGGAQVSRPGAAPVWLVLDGARVSISRPGDPLAATGDATEVTLVADERALLPTAREVGTQRPRTAMCVLVDGTVLTAHASFDTDEATTEALLDAGCDRVVALDRGAHDGVFLHRAGTDRAPEAGYEATAIYVLALPGAGTARDF